VVVAGGLTFASLSAGAFHSCGMTGAGLLYCWGDNTVGQLGDGTTINSNVPVKVVGQP
jgi:alpha-tubulin suppressor-like RCC1 family protein